MIREEQEGVVKCLQVQKEVYYTTIITRSSNKPFQVLPAVITTVYRGANDDI